MGSSFPVRVIVPLLLDRPPCRRLTGIPSTVPRGSSSRVCPRHIGPFPEVVLARPPGDRQERLHYILLVCQFRNSTYLGTRAWVRKKKSVLLNGDIKHTIKHTQYFHYPPGRSCQGGYGKLSEGLGRVKLSPPPKLLGFPVRTKLSSDKFPFPIRKGTSNPVFVIGPA